jgi:molybdate transport system substrate-binding protein
VAAGAPGTPIAAYTGELLGRAGLSESVRRNTVSYEETVKGIAAKIALGEADAGLVYAADRVGSIRKRTIAIEIPEAAGIDVAYRAAVVREAKCGKGAARFVNFLETERASEILRSFGFEVPR